MKKSCVGLVGVLGMFALVGCSQEANDAQTNGDNEVVGVTDLKELEQAPPTRSARARAARRQRAETRR